jgi:uncharacterized protein YndB with AHSA1/START domain
MSAPRRNDGEETAEIAIVRRFDAPRARVFESWVDAESLGAWFAPEGFTVTSCAMDARPGGRWQVAYRSPEGLVFTESGEICELEPPARLVLTLTQVDGEGRSGPRTVVTVTFEERGAQTEMGFRQTGFEPGPRRDGNAEGWLSCFRRLDAQLESEREVRARVRGTARADLVPR